MAKDNLTVFQRLTKTFGFMGQSGEQQSPSFNFSKEELLKTDSKEDYEKALLQAQQTQYISDRWKKIDQSMYNQSVYYEPNRLSAYYDFESMEFSLHGDTQIVTLDGYVTIKELADKGRGYEFITFAYDHNKKQVVPALARNAHYTRDEMTYKITFDDGSFIIATYGHRFLKRDGVYCKVEDLKIGDSMMPFYRKSFYNNQNYNWIYTCNSKVGHHGWVPEHTLVAEHMIRPLEKNEVVHHIDFNGKNNLVENLQILDNSEHQAFHARHNNKKLWSNPDYRKKMSKVAKKTDKYHWNGRRSGKNNPAYFELPIENVIDAAKTYKKFSKVVDNLKISRPKIRRTIKENGYKDWEDLLLKNNIKPDYKISYKCLSNESHPKFKHIPWDLLVDTALLTKNPQKTAKKLNVTWYKIIDDIKRNGYDDWKTFIDAYDNTKSINQNKVDVVNHKITSIEPYGIVPVYDLTVPGYKNFATDTIFSHNTPEVSAALDIYAEESTTTSEKGKILTIHSESKRIQGILEDLFKNVLDIDTNLQMWCRGMCKYGDNFVYLKIDPRKGIVGCQQLPNIEIERIEGATSNTQSLNVSTQSDKPTRELRFAWKNKDMEFQSWEIAHFRILGDDRKLPYGTCLKYDTKIDVEYGIKEIQDVIIGDMVWSLDLKTQKRVLSKVLDVVKSGKKTCYQLHTKHNFIEASKEHRILIFEKGEFIYKNVVDIRVGDVLVIDNSQKNSMDILIDKSQPSENKNGWFNDIDVFPDIVDNEFARFLGFMYGDGWISGNGVYFALSEYDDLNDFYIGLLNKYSKNPVKIVADKNGRETQAYVWSKCLKTVMERMGFTGKAHTKRIPNWVYQTSKDIQKSFLEGLIDADGWITQDKWSTHINVELCNESLVRDVKILVQKIGYKSGSIRKREPRKDVFIDGRKLKTIRNSYSLTFYDTYLSQTDKYDNPNRISDDYILEPINKIIDIGNHETYDIYVENENHNFYANGIVVHNSMLDKIRRIWKQLLLAEDAMLIYRISRAPERRVFKVFVGNMEDKDIEPYVQRVANKFKRDQVVDQRNGNVDMRYNQMAVDQDYFIPMRDMSQASPIETLPGAQNLGEIMDIEYIQKKLMAALRIPKAFLGFEEVVGNGKELALMDIRFARTINRIQKSLIHELNKIAIIHLYILGLEDELNNFDLSLTNPSAQSDLLRIEQWKEKILLYKDATSDQSQIGILPVSHTFAKKNILGMSNNEVILDLQQQRLERAIGQELMNTQIIIKRTGVFDEVDKKYGIPEEERQSIEQSGAQTAAPGGDMGMEGTPMGGDMTGAIPPPAGAPAGGMEAAPLGESRKNRILAELDDSSDKNPLFDFDKASRNIYEIENKINDILND